MLGPSTSQSIPFMCPTVTDGTSCRAAMLTKGAQPTATGYRLFPVPGACRIDVPDKCLPCTPGHTQW